ncbi:MAG TPA: isoprenyl transferase [bacterium]|nr:isoprenyl transferase [bacterium]
MTAERFGAARTRPPRDGEADSQGPEPGGAPPAASDAPRGADAVDRTRMPRHVAIIMDGNGRWAERHGLSRVEGHRAGREALRRVLRGACEYGIEVLTLYAFSTENWRRPAGEVHALMALLLESLEGEAQELHTNGVRFRASGLVGEMPPEVQDAIRRVTALTRDNGTIILNLALNYGSRRELTEAVRRIAGAVAAGVLAPDAIDEQTIARHLFAPDLPDPDLLIRTGGEQRLSNFLLWQAAYTELYFTDVPWPEFTPEHLLAAVAAYQARERRFGGVDRG